MDVARHLRALRAEIALNVQFQAFRCPTDYVGHVTSTARCLAATRRLLVPSWHAVVHPLEPDRFAPFDLWIAQAHKKPLAPRSVSSYRSMWSSWLKFLTPQGLSWDSAEQSVALRFLTSLKGRAYSDPRSSTVSKVRYATVLDKIYQHAKAAGLVAESPVRRNHSSLPKSESADSVFFRHEEYAALVDNLPVALTWQDARNRAVLACLLLDGLSGSEVAALRVGDVRLDGKKDARGRTRFIRLDIRATGGRPAQKRTVQLAWKTARAISEWLDLLARVRELVWAANDRARCSGITRPAAPSARAWTASAPSSPRGSTVGGSFVASSLASCQTAVGRHFHFALAES